MAVPANNDLSIDNYEHAELKLTGGNAQLNDVVVVGYGTQRRSNVTGAVAGVSKTAFSQPAASFYNLRIASCTPPPAAVDLHPAPHPAHHSNSDDDRVRYYK